MEVYGSAETFWLLLKDHLLGSPEYVSLIENYDIDFQANNLQNDSTSSFDKPKKSTTRNMSLAVEPDFNPKEFLKKESMRKSMNQQELRDSNVQVMWDHLDLEVSFEDNSFGCIQIEFSKKRNKKWKTLVSKRLKDVMDTRISITAEQIKTTENEFRESDLEKFSSIKKEYDPKQINYWRSVTNLKNLSKYLEVFCQKTFISKLLWVGNVYSSDSVSKFEKKNQDLKNKIKKGYHLIWRRNFLHNQIKRQEMSLSRNFYNGLKILVFTDFPEKISKIIQNDLARVRRY